MGGIPGREGSLGLTLSVRWVCVSREGAGRQERPKLKLRREEGPETRGCGHAGPGRPGRAG